MFFSRMPLKRCRWGGRGQTWDGGECDGKMTFLCFVYSFVDSLMWCFDAPPFLVSSVEAPPLSVIHFKVCFHCTWLYFIFYLCINVSTAAKCRHLLKVFFFFFMCKNKQTDGNTQFVASRLAALKNYVLLFILLVQTFRSRVFGLKLLSNCSQLTNQDISPPTVT